MLSGCVEIQVETTRALAETCKSEKHAVNMGVIGRGERKVENEKCEEGHRPLADDC